MSNERRLLIDACSYIESWLQFRYEHERIPGFAVAVYSKGEFFLKSSYGYADLDRREPLRPEHIFRIASHSKTFTATALMQLAEKGLLQLDDPVSKHVRWFKSKRDKQVQSVTIRQLLSHTAGIIRDGEDCAYWQCLRDFPDKQEFKKFIANSKCIFGSNSRFKYSNYGYTALGAVIEAVAGQDYNYYVTTQIIKKCGLKNTGPEYHKSIADRLATGYSRDYHGTERMPFPAVSTNYMSPATGFYSTVEDICRYGAAHFIGNTKLISDSSKRELHWPHSHVIDDDSKYGLGFNVWDIGSRRLVGHGGGFPGYITKTFIDTRNKLVVTAFTNCINGPAEDIAKGILSVIDFFLSYKSDSKTTLIKTELNRLCGRFYSQWGVSDFVRIGNSIVDANPEKWSPFEKPGVLRVVNNSTLQLVSKNEYWPEGELIKFKKNKSGKISAVKYAGTPMLAWERFAKERL